MKQGENGRMLVPSDLCSYFFVFIPFFLLKAN